MRRYSVLGGQHSDGGRKLHVIERRVTRQKFQVRGASLREDDLGSLQVRSFYRQDAEEHGGRPDPSAAAGRRLVHARDAFHHAAFGRRYIRQDPH